MPKFIILEGSIHKPVKRGDGSTKSIHTEGEEIEFSAEEAAFINRKGPKLEPLELHAARAKAKADAKTAIEKAENEAKAKLPKGGVK